MADSLLSIPMRASPCIPMHACIRPVPTCCATISPNLLKIVPSSTIVVSTLRSASALGEGDTKCVGGQIQPAAQSHPLYSFPHTYTWLGAAFWGGPSECSCSEAAAPPAPPLALLPPLPAGQVRVLRLGQL